MLAVSGIEEMDDVKKDAGSSSGDVAEGDPLAKLKLVGLMESRLEPLVLSRREMT